MRRLYMSEFTPPYIKININNDFDSRFDFIATISELLETIYEVDCREGFPNCRYQECTCTSKEDFNLDFYIKANLLSEESHEMMVNVFDYKSLVYAVDGLTDVFDSLNKSKCATFTVYIRYGGTCCNKKVN